MEWLILYVPKRSSYKLREQHNYWFTEKRMAVYLYITVTGMSSSWYSA